MIFVISHVGFTSYSTNRTSLWKSYVEWLWWLFDCPFFNLINYEYIVCFIEIYCYCWRSTYTFWYLISKLCHVWLFLLADYRFINSLRILDDSLGELKDVCGLKHSWYFHLKTYKNIRLMSGQYLLCVIFHSVLVWVLNKFFLY